ncbi:hypothetical protein EVAR_35958_1 [Eumeta japonica]|uniref:Uncharacterized protein n=1 Tax=Eumeta variegata TaxID=151549 RepID=A0A4C1W5A5_EUMVA|nr:hypothetical protein EVAR_35958_1 [Eumeta japonica]
MMDSVDVQTSAQTDARASHVAAGVQLLMVLYEDKELVLAIPTCPNVAGELGYFRALYKPLFLVFCRCPRRTARGRARIARAQPHGGGGHPAGGREAQLKLHTQPTAGGRTLVDADRIKAARVGDPRRRRSNRARLPITDQAIHASDNSSQGSTCQRAASFDLFVQSCLGCQSGAYAGPPAGARVAAHALSVGEGHRAVKRWLTRVGEGHYSSDARSRLTLTTTRQHAPATRQQHPKQHASVSSCPLVLLLALVSVVYPNGEGFPEASVHN